MKKVKIMLSAIVVLAVVGGTLAFKTTGQNRKCAYTSFSTTIGTQPYCSLPVLVLSFDSFGAAAAGNYAGTSAVINGDCTDAAIPVSVTCADQKTIVTAEQ